MHRPVVPQSLHSIILLPGSSVGSPAAMAVALIANSSTTATANRASRRRGFFRMVFSPFLKKSHDVVMTSLVEQGNHDSAPSQGDDSLRDLLPQPGPKGVRPALRTSANTPFPSPAGLGIRERLLFVAAPLSHLSHHGIISCRNVNPFSRFSCFSPPAIGPSTRQAKPGKKFSHKNRMGSPGG